MKTTIKAILKGAALGLAAVAVAVVLSSCGNIAGIPIKASVIGDYGVYSYSSKGGFEIQIHATK